MAAASAKNGLLKPQNRRSLYNLLFHRTVNSSATDPFSNTRNHRLDRATRFIHSAFNKPKTTELSVSSSRSSSSSSSSTPKSGLVGWYLNLLRTRPISTKCITSSLIYTAADISSQKIVNENMEEYDLLRTVRMAGYGMVILGPSVHYWYNFMSRVFPNRDLVSTLMKMTIGQTTFGPSMTLIFLSLNAASQGETGPEIAARLKRDLVPTLVNGVMYWPFCDFVTFKFVPVHLQPLVTNSFSYLWTVYMTYVAGLEKASAS